MAYQTKKVEQVFGGKRCKISRHQVIRNDEDGEKTLTFEVCTVANAVAVIPQREDGKILVLENYRYPVGKRMIELVAGLIEPGEDIEKAAFRECEEETGLVPDHIFHMGDFYTSPGLSTEKIHLFRAVGLQRGKQKLEDMEDLKVQAYHLAELVQMLDDGRIYDMKTALAISILNSNNLKGTMGLK